MREVEYYGVKLQKLYPGCYRLHWMGQDLAIESRGIYLFRAFDPKRKIVAQAGSLPALVKELKRLAEAEKSDVFHLVGRKQGNWHEIDATGGSDAEEFLQEQLRSNHTILTGMYEDLQVVAHQEFLALTANTK